MRGTPAASSHKCDLKKGKNNIASSATCKSTLFLSERGRLCCCSSVAALALQQIRGARSYSPLPGARRCALDPPGRPRLIASGYKDTNHQAAKPQNQISPGTGHPSRGLYKERLRYKLLENHLERVIVLTPTSLAISACVQPLDRIKRALAAFSSLLALTPVPV